MSVEATAAAATLQAINEGIKLAKTLTRSDAATVAQYDTCELHSVKPTRDGGVRVVAECVKTNSKGRVVKRTFVTQKFPPKNP